MASAEPGASFKGGGPGYLQCARLEAGARHSLQGGGRYVFWNYLSDRPSLVFSRNLAMSNLRHMPGSYSERYAEEVRVRLPSHYEPFELALGVPHQTVRFKGDESGAVSLDTYAAFPLDELTHGRNRWAEVGMFFFDRGYTVSHRWTRRVPVRRMPDTYLIRDDLPVGSYEYSIEAHDPVANTVAVARGALEARLPSPDSLALSDLLVADRIAVRSEPQRTREDLFIRGSADLGFAPDQPLGLYWEVYGLADRRGFARYRVTVGVRDDEDRSLPLRVLRAIGDVLDGGRERPELSWTREVDIAGRDRAVDWIELAALPKGRHRIVVTVEDLASGARASAERSVVVE